MHAIALFNSLCLEGRRVAVGLISRVPMSRDDASLYAHGGATRTAADRSLQETLARDTLAVSQAAASSALLLGDGRGSSGLEALAGSPGLRRSVRESAAGAAAGVPALQLELQLGGHGQLPATAPEEGQLAAQAQPAPAEYGVEVPATVAAAAAAAPARRASRHDHERKIAADERRRIAQRPETSEDLLDAMAQRTARRSALARRKTDDRGDDDDGPKRGGRC